jgi:hypothetical protein
MDNSEDLSQSLSSPSRSLEAACQKSIVYERYFKRIYTLRHKLQQLIYEKKPVSKKEKKNITY